MIPDDLVVQLRGNCRKICVSRSVIQSKRRIGTAMSILILSLWIYTILFTKNFLDFNTQFTERNNNYEFEDYTDEEFTRAYLEPLISILKNSKTSSHQGAGNSRGCRCS